MRAQPDLLDYVVDNPRTNQREVYRDGRIRLTSRDVSHPLLKHYSAAGPWGTYPPAPPASADSAMRIEA